jgi:tetratricopeptide (TPR) repeat protein
MKVLRTLIVLIISLSTLSGLAQNAKKLYKSGKDYSKIGNFEKAVELFTQAIDLDSDFTKAILARASAYEELIQYKKAAEDYETLSLLQPGKGDYSMKAGMFYFEAKEYQKAIPLLNSASETDAKNSKIYNLKAKCYFAIKNYPEALDEINTALQLEPSADNYYQRGLIHSESNNFSAAKGDFMQSLQLNSSNSDAYTHLAFAQLSLNEEENAIKSLNNAINVDNRNKSAYLLRSYIHRKQSNLNEAIKDLTTALTYFSNDKKVLLQRGIAYSENKQYNEAIEDLTKVLRTEKDEKLALKYRAQSYQALNKKNEAIKDYEELLAVVNKDDNQKDFAVDIKNQLFELQREGNKPQIVIIQKNKDSKLIEVPEGPDEAPITIKIIDQSDLAIIKIDGFEVKFNQENIKSGEEILAEIAEKNSLKIEVEDVYGNTTTETFRLKRVDTGFPRVVITVPLNSKGNKIVLSELSEEVELQGRIVSKYKIESFKIDDIPVDFVKDANNPPFRVAINIKDKTSILFDVIDTEGNHLSKQFSIDKADAELLSKNPMGRTWVVFVENSDYVHFTNLEGPKKEVNLMVKALDNYQIDKVIHKKNMTKAQMDWFFRQELKKQIIENRVNSIMVWYAGHGKYLNQKGYWIPVDSKVDDLSTYYNLNSLKTALKPYTKVITHSLIVTDACESGPSFYMSMRSLPTDRDCNNAKSTKLKSSQVFTSTREDITGGDSQFTESFANSLIYNSKSCIPIEQIVNKVSGELLKTSNKRPKFGKISGFGDENGSFIFIKK